MNVYLDSSAQIRLLTGDGPSLPGNDSWERAFSSGIARLETRRTLDRLRLTNSLPAEWFANAMASLLELESGFTWLEVRPDVLARAAEPFGLVLSALDALHVTSAVIIRASGVPDLVFATHDRQQAIGAMAFGFSVIGVEI